MCTAKYVIPTKTNRFDDLDDLLHFDLKEDKFSNFLEKELTVFQFFCNKI